MRRYYKELIKDGTTIITAHSGCEGTPPNSIEHINAAIASGAEIVEVDVRMRDGLLFLSHDAPEDISGRATLEDCFRLVKETEDLSMNLDLKTPGLVTPMLDLAEKYGLCERIVFTGACNDCRAQAVSRGADMWRSMWKGDSIPDGIAANRLDGSPALNVWHPMINEEYDRELKSFSNGFSAWTVDDEADIIRFLKLGIRNITTRKPVLALSLREKYAASR